MSHISNTHSYCHRNLKKGDLFKLKFDNLYYILLEDANDIEKYTRMMFVGDRMNATIIEQVPQFPQNMYFHIKTDDSNGKEKEAQ